MEGFNPTAGLYLITLTSFVLAFVFFTNAIFISLSSKKSWNRQVFSTTMWGFAFVLLGYLGNYFSSISGTP